MGRVVSFTLVRAPSSSKQWAFPRWAAGHITQKKQFGLIAQKKQFGLIAQEARIISESNLELDTR
jgi:hypothetical protein